MFDVKERMQMQRNTTLLQATTAIFPCFGGGIRTMAMGITLLDLLIGITVLALLLTLTLPTFGKVLRDQRASTASHLLGSDFAHARMVAITHRIPVTVCPSENGLHCSNSSHWTHGWITYRDPKRSQQPANEDAILRATRLSGQSLHLSSSVGRPRIRYQPNGRSSGTNLTVHVCADDVLLRQVIVNNSGRVRTKRHSGERACSV